MKTSNATLLRGTLSLGLAFFSAQIYAQAMPSRALTVPGQTTQMPTYGGPPNPASAPALGGQAQSYVYAPLHSTPGWDVGGGTNCSELLTHEKELTALLKKKIAVLEAIAAAKSGGPAK